MKIKHSIKLQISFLMIGLIAATILLCWFINSTFLGSYYIENKKNVLLYAYESINDAAAEGRINSEEYDIELQRICGKYNISMVVIDSNSQTVKSTFSSPDLLIRQLWDNLFGKKKQGSKMLVETEEYFMHTALDPRTSTEYIEMWGFLQNGNLFLLRTALEGIRDSVSISNRFLAYVGLISVVSSGLIIWMVAKRVTEPILELTAISKKMSSLDFDVKYTGKEKNEIGLLGDHINQLSLTLEKTISELNTANNELKKDIEKKTQIDDMRKEFLSNVSHELKTPIALIQGYAEGLKEGIIDDEESKEFYCDVIMDEASKMNHMVKKLLTLNQLEFGNDVITMERFDITELIQTCVQSASILARQNGIHVKIEEMQPVNVWGDEFKVEEVFMNYFSNAIHHCSGEKIIHIRTLKKEGTVRVSIFNTGEIIPEESIPHLWEKFYKVDKARTREYGGSGVGLSIVKAIMESMNQDFGVNNYTNGVEFWFELSSN